MAVRVSTKTLLVVAVVLSAILLGSIVAGLVLTRQPTLTPVPVPTLSES